MVRARRKKWKTRVRPGGLLMLIGFMLCFAAGCAAAGNTGAQEGADALELKDCHVFGECRGGEADQYIIAELTFDREVELSGGLPSQLRAVIGGKRIAEEDISAEQTGTNTVKVSLHVDRVVDGVLKLSAAPGTDALSAVREAGGKACLRELDVEQMVPSGVTLHEEGPGDYLIDSTPTHRSIVWIRVQTEQGMLKPDGAASTDVMDDAAAVHEHEFLWATTSSVAADIADTVNKYYGTEVMAEARENHVLLHAADGTAPVLEIYEG